MIKKIILLIRLIILKLRYTNKLIFNKNLLKNKIEEVNNITMLDGKIIIEENIKMKKGARLGVNKGGVINIGSCSVNSNTIIASLGEITIGKNVSIGPNVCIYDHDHSFGENGKHPTEYKIGKIIIGNNVWIGAGAIILRDTVIGDNSIIGAGTIVKGEIPNNSLVTSNREMKISKLEKR